MVQDWIVGGVVLLAALYVVWYGLPMVWRRHLGRLHPTLGISQSCGSCSSCNACAGATPFKRLADPDSAAQVIRFYRKT